MEHQQNDTMTLNFQKEMDTAVTYLTTLSFDCKMLVPGVRLYTWDEVFAETSSVLPAPVTITTTDQQSESERDTINSLQQNTATAAITYVNSDSHKQFAMYEPTCIVSAPVIAKPTKLIKRKKLTKIFKSRQIIEDISSSSSSSSDEENEASKFTPTLPPKKMLKLGNYNASTSNRLQQLHVISPSKPVGGKNLSLVREMAAKQQQQYTSNNCNSCSNKASMVDTTAFKTSHLSDTSEDDDSAISIEVPTKTEASDDEVTAMYVRRHRGYYRNCASPMNDGHMTDNACCSYYLQPSCSTSMTPPQQLPSDGNKENEPYNVPNKTDAATAAVNVFGDLSDSEDDWNFHNFPIEVEAIPQAILNLINEIEEISVDSGIGSGIDD